MATDAEIRTMGALTAKIVDDCADQVYRNVIDTGTWVEEEGYRDVLEQSVLALILAGLMARAQQRGIGWASVQTDAEIADRARRALPVTEVVQ